MATPEIPLGTIAQDLTRRDSVSNKDTVDNFAVAFTLTGNSGLGINLRELGNQKGDVKKNSCSSYLTTTKPGLASL